MRLGIEVSNVLEAAWRRSGTKSAVLGGEDLVGDLERREGMVRWLRSLPISCGPGMENQGANAWAQPRAAGGEY